MIGKVIRVTLVCLAILSLSSILPETYRKAFKERSDTPDIIYSEILDDFLLVSSKKDSLKNKYISVAEDTKGNIYNADDIKVLTPVRSFKQLEYEQRFPDTICGVAVTPQMILESYSFPSFLGASGVQKYPFFWMFESEAEKIELPKDVFRIDKKGIEFIDIKSNKVNKEKSLLFNEALVNSGFSGPSKNICGVTSLTKPVDDGYFIIDSKDMLYHLKMSSSLPICKKIQLPQGVIPFHMNCMSGGNYFGYFYDTDKNIYLMNKPSYDLKKIPIDDYKEFEPTIIVESNMFYTTFTLSSAAYVKKYILTPDYNYKSSYKLEKKRYIDTKPYMYESYVFPLIFNVDKRGKINYSLNNPSKFIFLNIILLIIFIFIKIYKKRELLNIFNIADYIIVLVFGIYGFISVFIFPNRK